MSSLSKGNVLEVDLLVVFTLDSIVTSVVTAESVVVLTSDLVVVSVVTGTITVFVTPAPSTVTFYRNCW